MGKRLHRAQIREEEVEDNRNEWADKVRSWITNTGHYVRVWIPPWCSGTPLKGLEEDRETDLLIRKTIFTPEKRTNWRQD